MYSAFFSTQKAISKHFIPIRKLSMRSKTQFPINLKLLLLGFFLAFLLLFTLRSSFSSPQQNPTPIPKTQLAKASDSIKEEEKEVKPKTCQPPPSTPTCTKIPTSLVQPIIHYATSNITPQQTFKEISVTAQVLEKKSPCNFLVFGLGHDSLMWAALNHGGQTVFLEEDKSWIEQIRQRFPTLESHHVMYDTKVRHAEDLMKIGKGEECLVVGDPRSSKCQLALKGMPLEVYEKEWDLIMVDAPTGYFEDAPGRMSAIYTAGLMARNRENGETDVFVHDVDRVVEDKFSLGFLCDGYMRQQEGRIRHFTIPSHRANLGRPFCP